LKPFHVQTRNAGFWAAVVNTNTSADARQKLVDRIHKDVMLDPLDKERAIKDLDQPDIELSKLGFWEGLRKIQADAKKQAEEDFKTAPVQRATSSRAERRRVLEDYNIVPGTPEYNQFYANHTQSELAVETGVPDQCIDDPLLHIAMMKYNRLKEQYSIKTDEEEKKFVESFDISAGVMSLEAAFGGVIPEHTFTELPIIKEPEPEKGGKHH
jgi:hypothetical protein